MHINRIIFVVLISVVLLQSCGNTKYSYKDIDKRKVLVKTDDDIIEAAVYDGFDTKKILSDRNYYWFDHSMIMSTRGGFTGELLHGEFLVQYRNYQIKEQGNFKYGLKHGTWKSWYENGLPKNFVTYKKGILHGKYTEYDSKGVKSEDGNYKMGLKTGTVLVYNAEGKPDKVQYKNGKEVIKKEKPIKEDTTTLKPVAKNASTNPSTVTNNQDSKVKNLPNSNNGKGSRTGDKAGEKSNTVQPKDKSTKGDTAGKPTSNKTANDAKTKSNKGQTK